MAHDVFGIDTPCIDLNVNFSEMPERNTGTMVRRITWQGGGKVSSGMVAASRLGADCAIAGSLGDDIFGRFCYQDFIRHGVDVSQMKLVKDTTTHLSVVLSEGKTQTRTVMFRIGSVPPLSASSVDWSMLREAKYLFISGLGSPLADKAIEVAHESGVKVFIDADTYSDKLRERISDLDILVGSEFVFDALYPESKGKDLALLEDECRKLLDMGPEIVVFTFGERGCVGISKDDYFVLPAFKVDVQDTVGAGDVFHGAFLAALIQGKTVKECALWASGTSAIKCTRIGGRAGIPSIATLERFLKDGSIDYTEIDDRVAYYERGLEHV